MGTWLDFEYPIRADKDGTAVQAAETSAGTVVNLGVPSEILSNSIPL